MFLAGKGGVGKTTCAAALALALGERAREKLALGERGREKLALGWHPKRMATLRERVLVASVDPAHSLADVLAVPVGAAPRAVPGTRGRVAAVEIAAERAARRFVLARRPALDALAESAGALDREDVERLLALPLPAVDEFAALLGLARWAAAGYDHVVVDTAPSGHFLELVRTPGLLGDLARGFDATRAEAREVRAHLSGRRNRDVADRFIDELDGLASGLAGLLRDRERTTVRWVLVPEVMSLAETLDGIAALDAAGLRVEEIVVNRWPRREPGRLTAGDRDRRRVLSGLALALPHLPIRLLPLEASEPRGAPALRRFGKRLLAGRAKLPEAPAPRRVPARPRVALPTRSPASGAPAALRLLGPKRRVVLVTGKGGVGKTTVAAALVLLAATGDFPSFARSTSQPSSRRRLRPVRLLSVDPAHSLGDVLETPFSDAWKRLSSVGRGRRVAHQRGDILVRELSADAVWRAWRSRLDAVLARDPAAEAAFADLLGTPEGFAEIAAAFEIAATLDDHPTSLLVVDCPPTGHTLRLLAAPALAVEWIHAGLATLLKYRQIAPLGPFADWLLERSRSLARLRDLLRDGAASATVVVDRPGTVIEAETRRLGAALRRHATAPATRITLGFPEPTRSRRRAGRQRAASLPRDRGAKGCAIIEAPLRDPPPLGSAELLNWAATWIESSEHSPPSQ